ncbi:MAG: Lrp/AsnC ligand binding domain-containing protein [Nitrosotalea sp.]
MTQEMQAQFDAKRDKKIQDDKICPTFAFISCQPGKETLVIRKLQTLKSVKEILRTHGKYDILVKLENMTESELRELINNEILHMNVVLSVMNLTSACVA